MSFRVWLKRILCYALMLSVTVTPGLPARAALAADTAEAVDFEQVDNAKVSAGLLTGEGDEPATYAAEDDGYKPEDVVRVSIVLDEAATIEAGYELEGIAKNSRAMSYRKQLKSKQDAMKRTIEKALGDSLTVKWNLTLAANLISAEVQYRQIDKIRAVDGVRDVVIEQQYQPMAVQDVAEPKMTISNEMTGMKNTWQLGYTGAGSRVAIIDTGIDVDHQSFSSKALDYALEQNAKAENLNKDTYLAGLDLLDAAEIDEVMNELNIVGISPGVRGSNVYHDTKLAFAYNYIDHNSDYIDHNRDTQTDHGSHVAGIAAANRYIEQDNQMVDALNAVNVTGAAPDAQLLVMKVFGMQGGAYDSDYMAAIEDAIILGADSINLSLGSSANGYASAGKYQEIMAGLTEAGAVVCMAAGNEGNFMENAQTKEQIGGSGLLYTDDVQTSHMASPASYTNSMAVASVENQGMVSNAFLSFDDGKLTVGYSETLYGKMKAMTSLDSAESGGTEYDFVMIEGLGNDEDFTGIDVTNKIVFIPRGTLAFYDKANNAVKHGALATVIFNNVDGSIAMNMTDYKYENPAVSITKAYAEKIRALATKQTTIDGNKNYYTGKMRVCGTTTVNRGDKDSYTMSSFSSWGTTGDLALKPEITAPGGSIYSVNGSVEATDQYKLNSGTSMATPQVTGITAAIGQYIREAKLTDKFGHSSRQIAQSLLMSTAIPMKDANGHYYPLLQQGSGLANGENAVKSGAYIMMGKDATPSWADGKVKAELGDDPTRTGVYDFSFTIYNTENAAKKYDLSAELFTHDVKQYPSAPGAETKADYMLTGTRTLASTAKFTQGSTAVTTVTVPANGKLELKAELTVTAEGKQWLGEHYKNGTYIYGYVFMKPQAVAGDGAVSGVDMHIPMLAFYGNWTEPAMFDAGSWKDGKVVDNYSTPATTDESRTSYGIEVDSEDNVLGSYCGQNYVMMANEDGVQYKLGGNPLVDDEEYLPERNAIAVGASAEYWHYLPLRDSYLTEAEIKDVTNNKVLWSTSAREDVRGEYYYSNLWQSAGASLSMYQELKNVEVGSRLELSLTRLPEYYAEGNMGEKSTPGAGATVKIEVAVDGESPVAKNISYDSKNGKLTVQAADENYVAAVALYTRDGKKVISYCGADGDLKKGETGSFVLDVANAGGDYLLQVYDYAMNTVTYRMNIGGEKMTYSGAMLAFDPSESAWVQVDEQNAKHGVVADSKLSYTAAVAVGNRIYAVAYRSELFALDVKHPDKSERIGDTEVNIVDLAYNAQDGYLYGVTDDSRLARIDKTGGKTTIVGALPIKTNTLACDSKGNFYSNLLGSGKVYTYTLDALGAGTAKADAKYDVNNDGTLDIKDVQAVLDAASGKAAAVNCDLNADGRTDTYDAYLLLQKLPGSVRQVADCGLPSAYLQALEVDPNNDELYWASYSTEKVGTTEVGFAYLYKIDTINGTVTNCGDMGEQLACLVLLDKDAGSGYAPLYDLANIGEAEDAVAAQATRTYLNSYASAAALAVNMGVDNSGKEADTRKTVEIDIAATGDVHNGLYKVAYPSGLEYVGASSALDVTSVNVAGGVVTLAVAGMTPVAANDTIATLTFKAADCADDVSLTRAEENATRPAAEEKLESGAHSWGEWTVTRAATCKTAGEKTRSCTNCPKTQTASIAVSDAAHKWGEWQTGSKLGDLTTRYRECAECGSKQTVPYGANITLTEQNSAIARVWAQQHVLDYAQVSGVGVQKVEKVTLTDTGDTGDTDNTVRYLVTLTANTADNAKFHTHLQVMKMHNGSKADYALKKNKVDSVSWDADDTEYDVQLENGAACLKFYGYENSTQCTPFEIYFRIGDEGALTGKLNKVTLDGVGEPDITGLEVWECSGVDKVLLQTNTDKTSNDVYIWLDKDTPKDATLPVYVQHSGGMTQGTGTQKLSNDSFMVTLTGGSASATVTLTKNGASREYRLHFGVGVNVGPELQGAATGAARVKVGTVYQLDLGQVFKDDNGNKLTYSYKLNGADAVTCDEKFSYTAETRGEYVFVFTANDGRLDSPTYTLTLTASDKDTMPGDVNGDNKITIADVVLLERYLAGWSNVTVEDGADVNGDSRITIADVVLLERYLAGWAGIVLGGK